MEKQMQNCESNNMEQTKYFCRNCGSELIEIKRGLEEIPNYGYGSRNERRYDTKTGERVFVSVYECPKYTYRSFLASGGHLMSADNIHDRMYFNKEGIFEYVDRDYSVVARKILSSLQYIFVIVATIAIIKSIIT